MSNFGPADLILKFDDSGGTLRTITPYIMTINGFDVEAVMEETTAFGKSWRESKATGIRMVANIVLGGNFDDTAVDGPDVVFKGVASGPSSATRSFEITYGSTLKSACETTLQKYSRKPGKQLTKFEATLEPFGAVTET